MRNGFFFLNILILFLAKFVFNRKHCMKCCLATWKMVICSDCFSNQVKNVKSDPLNRWCISFTMPLFLQTVSVSVSVLTLSCIALDRWYAICHPLMFKSTAKRARNSIVIIWIVSCIIMIPQAIVMECSSMLPGLANKTTLFTVCDEHWGGKYMMAHKPTFILEFQMFP